MSYHQRQTAYRRTADLIRQAIISGEYAQNEKLPSEQMLCQRYDVSRITIRRALEILEQERVVLRRHGLGTFVLEKPTARQPIILGSAVEGASSPLVYQVSRMHGEVASKQIAKEFGLPACKIISVKRSGYREDQLVIYECIQLLEEHAGKLKAFDFKMHNWLRRWRQLQTLPVTHVSQHLSAIPASAALASILELEMGTPLLFERKFVRSDTGILGRIVSYYPGERVQFDAVQQVMGVEAPTAGQRSQETLGEV